MMRRCRFNRQTEPCPQSGGRRSRSDVADRTGHIVALRQNRPEMRTVLLPLSAVGKTCQFERVVALLKRIDGFSSACLFFNQTALRIYYHPERTNVFQIVEALQALKPNLCDYSKLEKDLPRTSVCG